MIHFPRCHVHKAVRWVLAVYRDLHSGCCQRPLVLPSLRLAMRLRGLLHSMAAGFQEQVSQENHPHLQALIKLPRASYLLMSHWPQKVPWPSPESLGEGGWYTRISIPGVIVHVGYQSNSLPQIIFVSIKKKIGVIFLLVHFLLVRNLISMFPKFSVGLRKPLGGKVLREKNIYGYIKSGK